MKSNSKHIDQSTAISALQSEVSDLKDMLTMMQQIIVTQNKQISDIHKCLFEIKNDNPSKEDKKKFLKAKIILRTH